ncbi:hypothetical protein [Simplicispira suum]|uniref:Uncharacterized protein n=1 Tax=Simplicispira suum TaxID=2109915 RepID=A0A2S0MZY7_9BURK|nr:hypothetical protein [Simplicispira suum]AVO41271.1 hypothetical protein C6571_08190 [Simplicispira suum]
MQLKTVVKAGVVMTVAFFAIESIRTSYSPRHASPAALATRAALQVPVQSSTDKPAFAFKGFQIQPLARFAIDAKVLSREDYYLGREAELAPMDLALGWKRMAEPAVYRQLDITQGRRWYFYRWRDAPPIPVQEIVESSANMHLIPANAAVEKTLRKAREGASIRITGQLVQATDASGWRWTSSLSRADSGADSCELVFVESAQVQD